MLGEPASLSFVLSLRDYEMIKTVEKKSPKKTEQQPF